MFPLVDGFIPECWLLDICGRLLKLKFNDCFELLLTTCSDTICAVTDNLYKNEHLLVLYNDMHLKNSSLMHNPEGIVLSRAYDLVNVNLIDPKDQDDLAHT